MKSRVFFERAHLWRVPAVAGVEAFKACFANFSYARHTHDSYALGVIDTGVMRFWHRGAVHAATPGSVIVINPGEVHDGHSDRAQICRYRMVYVERAAIDELFASDVPEIGRICALEGPVVRDAALERAIRAFHRALERDAAGRPDALESHSYLTRMLHLLFARHGVPPLALPERAPERHRIELAKEFIGAHLSDAVRLTELATTVGLSPWYLLRSFRDTVGLPPHAYMNQLRLHRARALLRRGRPCAFVAAELGFVDQSHFTRRFKAAFGVTPGQYARS